MLSELLSKQQQLINGTIARYTEIGTRLENIEKERENINTRMSRIILEKKELTIYKKRNFIQEFFYKRFSKQYKKDVEEEQKMAEEKSVLEKKREGLRKEKSDLEDEKRKINVVDLKNELERTNDREYAIKKLIADKPELCENPEFMKELIKEDIKYISMDKSNDKQLYKEFMQIVISNLEKNPGFQTENAIKKAQEIIAEIDNPSEVPEGRYKIPQKYLFESIRSVNLEEDEGRENKQIEMIYKAHRYFTNDGKLPIEYGTQMEELYEDENNYLLYHTINSSFWAMPQDDIIRRRDSIFVEGLRASTQDEDCINNLVRTTIGNYQDDVCFINFLQPDPRIIMLIPKTAFNDKYPTTIWGSDHPNADIENPGYILPEYIIGYVDPIEEKLELNPVPKNERKQYKYKFAERSLQSMESIDLAME